MTKQRRLTERRRKPCLTYHELIHSLTRVTWHLTSDGMLRDDRGMCPILSAYRHRFSDGEIEGNWNWRLAARVLGLPSEIAMQVASDADSGRDNQLRIDLGLKGSHA